MSVGGAAIITKLKLCHIILLASKSTIFEKFGCVSFSCNSNSYFYSYFILFLFIDLFFYFSYLFCTDLFNLFTQINLLTYNIKTSIDG